jgi:hypothetical protein
MGAVDETGLNLPAPTDRPRSVCSPGPAHTPPTSTGLLVVFASVVNQLLYLSVFQGLFDMSPGVSLLLGCNLGGLIS